MELPEVGIGCISKRNKTMPDNRRDEHFNQDRRSFLKAGALVGLGAAFTGLRTASAAEEHAAGEARRSSRSSRSSRSASDSSAWRPGIGHLGSYLSIDGVQIKAICDIVPAHVARAQDAVVKAGQRSRRATRNGPTDFQRMCETEDLDLVMTATPWEWHVRSAVAMKNGKHVATEVPAAMTLDDCWKLVEIAKKPANTAR